MALKVSQCFSLIEFMIYSAISLFLVVLIMHVIVSFEGSVVASQASATYNASLYIGLDNFVRLARQAPMERNKWGLTGTDSISWTSPHGLTKFAFAKKKLLYISRTYDSQGKLQVPVTSVLATQVEGSFFIESHADRVIAIHLALTATTTNKILHIRKEIPLIIGQLI